ncbi:hypothetical protein EK904_004933 [Melospiza melodia maxima]|nr:hypothetical protein EK904_004933 [Melospiza melodia maxima]
MLSILGMKLCWGSPGTSLQKEDFGEIWYHFSLLRLGLVLEGLKISTFLWVYENVHFYSSAPSACAEHRCIPVGITIKTEFTAEIKKILPGFATPTPSFLMYILVLWIFFLCINEFEVAISSSFLCLLLWNVEQEGKVKNPLLGSAEIPLGRALNPVLQPWMGFIHSSRVCSAQNYLLYLRDIYLPKMLNKKISAYLHFMSKLKSLCVIVACSRNVGIFPGNLGNFGASDKF